MTCYLFNQSPETHSSWTLAVFAISRNDALEYIKHHHPGMKLKGEVSSEKVNADCGACTEAQRTINRINLKIETP